MPKRYKNVYMGPNSTAKLPVRGKVNEDWEILLNTYATAYDAINGKMLTREPGKFDPATQQEVNGRFAVLKRLAAAYAPEKLPAIEELHRLTLLNISGQLSDREFLKRIRALVVMYGLDPSLVDYAEKLIDEAERRGR